jgi:hypothetical protein
MSSIEQLPPIDLASFSVGETLRTVELQRLEEISAERVRRHEESLRLYEPMPDQDAFHQSKASERLLRGGNRGGKSLAAFLEDARCAMGVDPYQKYPTHRPLQIWIIGFDEGHLGRVVYRLLFQKGAFRVIRDLHSGMLRTYRPWQEEDRNRHKESSPASPLIPERYAPPEAFAWKDKARRIFTVVRLEFPDGHPMNGTEIHCFPSGGQAPQGSAVDLIHIDEDLKYARHVPEYQARLSDNEGGKLIWSAMPHMKNQALIEMSSRAEEQQELEEPDVEEFRLTFSGNQYIDAKQKALRLAGWSVEERRLRDQGDFVFDVVAMYPEFDVTLHGVPSKFNKDQIEGVLLAGQVPQHWTRYMIVDPGHSFGAALFAAVPPPQLGNFVLAYDELYIRNCTAKKFADAAAKKAGGQEFRAFIIDDHGSRAREAGTGLSVRQQYSQELRRVQLRSEITGYGFIKGSDEVFGRTTEVRRWLTLRDDGTTRFRVLQNKCPQMIREFRNYKKRVAADESQDRPIKANDHLMNCLEYLAPHNPRYYKPKKSVPEESLVYKEFQSWQNSPRRLTGRDRFFQGSAGGSIYLGPGVPA